MLFDRLFDDLSRRFAGFIRLFNNFDTVTDEAYYRRTDNSKHDCDEEEHLIACKMDPEKIYTSIFIDDFTSSIPFGEGISDKVDKPAADSVSSVHDDVEKTESERRTLLRGVSFDRNRNNGRDKRESECERNETDNENDNRICDEGHRQTRNKKEEDAQEHDFPDADRIDQGAGDHTDARKQDRPYHDEVAGHLIGKTAVSRKPEGKHRVHRGIGDILDDHVSEKDPHVAGRFVQIFHILPDNNSGGYDTGNKERDS